MAFNNVPANGWPQIKELEKLDALAKAIEDMPTFTSNDKAFLEELPAFPAVDGKKMLAANTSEGTTTLAYEELPDELPADPESDGTRVLTATTSSGETVKSWETAESGIDYSTTEQNTGIKWIDGKEIYSKTIDCGTLPDNTSKLVAAGLSNVTVVKIEGVAIGESSIPLPHISTNSVYIEISYEASNEVFIRTNGYFSTMHGYVTLYYTKNTV